MRAHNYLALIAAVLMSAPASAADVDRYLPVDSEAVVVINVRQFLDSKLVRKFDLGGKLKAAIAGNKEADDLLKALNFDPLKDLDKIIAAAPGDSNQEKGLAIALGRFDPDKIKATAEKAAKDHPDIFTIREATIGQDKVSYLEIKGGAGPGIYQTTFAAVASKNVVFASPSREYLFDALRSASNGASASLANKNFAELLKGFDDKHSLWLATAGDLTKGEFAAALPIKDELAKLSAITGSVTVTDGVKLEVALIAKTADDAKALNTKISQGLQTVIALVALAAMNQPELQPLVDFAKSIKTTANDKTVTIRGELDAAAIDKLIKAAQGE